ncbi:hypothetical protein V865_006936 [Kwoniella europaea PYCC6329]|uniref:Transmembrane protein n=1 Tax=Kwoniella europaea PYCC6329 TaxID=1423913 RepID=A0AAX4KR08_9TREE
MSINTDRDRGRQGIGTIPCPSPPVLPSMEMGLGIRLDNVEAGPSRLSSSSQEMCKCEICVQPDSSRPRTASRSLRSSARTMSTKTTISSFLPLFLLPFLPTSLAAPPPSRRLRRSPSSTSSTPTSTPTATSSEVEISSSFNEHRNIQYLTSVSTPSVLPTYNEYVDETVLPYLLTRHEEGHWTRAEGGWSLYGRQVATPTAAPIFADDDGEGTVDNPQPTVTAPSYAVESVLPNGWGVSSNRTSIYKVPLISIASVILACGIVGLIVFIVISRRKKHRKRKRAKERLRRKALAAAGIREEDLNSGAGGAKEVAFKEKLKELENQHSAKKRKNGQMVVAKNKVRVWNSRLGMRRRKSKGGQKEKEIEEDEDGAVRASSQVDDNPGERGEEEDKPIEGVDEIQPISISPTSTLDRDRNGVDEERQGSRLNRSSTDSMRGGDQPGVRTASRSRSQRDTQDPSNDGRTPIAGSSTDQPQNSIPHFPPAYRPASVRSLPRHRPDPSTSSASAGPSNPSDPPVVVSGTEKTQAPGYYPAPATEDGEIALAVVSRAEGKSRLIEPQSSAEDGDEEGNGERDEERIRHVATDDKRVLERLRMGGSAPPVNRPRFSDQDQDQDQDADRTEGEGPSAPFVQVDEQGFEQLDESLLQVPSPATDGSRTEESGNGLLPAPPRLNARLSSRLSDIPSPSTVEVDTSHLLPSAPPALDQTNPARDHDIPSAPPMLGEDEDGVEEVSVPSAPTFVLDEDEEAESTGSPSAPMESSTNQEQEEQEHGQSDEDRQEVGNRRDSEVDAEADSAATFSNALPARSGSGAVFLPRYEP